MRYLRLALCIMGVLFLFVQGMSQDALADKRSKKRYVGTVTSISIPANEFTITNKSGEKVVIHVTPETEFEMETGMHMLDDEVPFSELKENDWVKVKVYDAANERDLASEVEIYRKK